MSTSDKEFDRSSSMQVAAEAELAWGHVSSIYIEGKRPTRASPWHTHSSRLHKTKWQRCDAVYMQMQILAHALRCCLHQLCRVTSSAIRYMLVINWSSYLPCSHSCTDLSLHPTMRSLACTLLQSENSEMELIIQLYSSLVYSMH